MDESLLFTMANFEESSSSLNTLLFAPLALTPLPPCQLAPTPEVQFVTLEIPPELPPQWMAQGYTYIHFGAIRLALNYHGRKDLPVSVHIGLLDIRMRKYHHASIATIETTLNVGTMVVTLFPDFNMSLRDNRLTDAFKVEV
ncbi:hypothetical protein F8388_022631 [Cannabis sativa]|uniref:Uncharacterized protein n=1 Tax=Cannabis sativa TaxID=3483 RepID=A0A7J6G1Q7_CANSA|nr:hypothetical protein F8388_022631 [Cannabis sativa]